METINIKDLIEKYQELDGKEVAITGWIKTNRDSKSIGFLSINDGTTLKNIQAVYKQDITKGYESLKTIRTGSAIIIIGNVKLTPGQKQDFEVIIKTGKVLKQADHDYPLQKKHHSVEFLRDIAHLRPRTQLYNAVMRVRSKIAFAIHQFFNQEDFVWCSSPIITSNDAEGAGEFFSVTTNEKESFFNGQSSLTVTGQLQAEAYALAFKKVYTFGPTFRAEKSHTNRHISEFWMIEPEVAFTGADQMMSLAESLLKYLIEYYFKNCKDELAYFMEVNDENLEKKLTNVLESKFIKIEYKDAIGILQQAISNGVSFEEEKIIFGMDLASEHEKYISDVFVKGPVFITNYPREIKAFYMKQNDDGLTVAAFDLLAPGIGEIIGGSEREADFDKLLNRCNQLNLDTSSIEWYLELRRYGYFQSSGFGLGFERVLMYLTGMTNIKDTIPFPRSHGNIKY